MGDRCMNEGCGAWSDKWPGNCTYLNHGLPTVSGCGSFTTNSAISVNKERLAELVAWQCPEKRQDIALLSCDLAKTYKAEIEGLKDPATVWANMLRGTIAKPQQLEYLEGKVSELTAEVEAKDKQFRSCCEHGGNCADPPPEYCPQCVDRSRAALVIQDSVVKDLTEQCRSFHGQVADLQADLEGMTACADSLSQDAFTQAEETK